VSDARGSHKLTRDGYVSRHAVDVEKTSYAPATPTYDDGYGTARDGRHGNPYVQTSTQPPQYARGYDDDFSQAPVSRRATPRTSRARSGAASAALLVCALVLRVLALALFAVVIVYALPANGLRAIAVGPAMAATQLLPMSLATSTVLNLPFGGSFRGDVAIVCVVLLVIDYVVSKVRGSML